MIKAIFKRNFGRISSFRMSGHAGFAEAGSDIVCAAASSSVQFAVNLLDVLSESRVRIRITSSEVCVRSIARGGSAAEKTAEALFQHLKDLSERYPGTVSVHTVARRPDDFHG